MGRQLTLPSNRICAAAKIAAVSLYEDEKKPYTAIDVGCDHAKLAIYLVQSGICSHVTACDINEGPVNKAKENISRRTMQGKKLSEFIDVVCTDGLAGLENTDANRIFILGMGGELIANILNRANFYKLPEKHGKIKFVLQPMTSEDKLREYLYKNGFILWSASMFTFVSCCILNNNFVGELFLSIALWSFKAPGLIFTFDLDGCLWFIGMKILFAILGFLAGVAAFVLALLVGCFVSLFTYPYAIVTNIKHPERTDI